MKGWLQAWFFGDKMNLILVWILVVLLLTVSQENITKYHSLLNQTLIWLFLWPFMTSVPFLFPLRSEHAAVNCSGKCARLFLKRTWHLKWRPLQWSDSENQVKCISVLIWEPALELIKFNLIFSCKTEFNRQFSILIYKKNVHAVWINTLYLISWHLFELFLWFFNRRQQLFNHSHHFFLKFLL